MKKLTATRNWPATRADEEGNRQAGLGTLQELQREGRLAAAVLQKELTAFRNALRAVLGSSHRDYLTLRDKRADGDDDEDDTANAEGPADPDAPAANPNAVNGAERPSTPT